MFFGLEVKAAAGSTKLTTLSDVEEPLSEPAQWGAAYSHRWYRMRGRSDRAAAFIVKGDLL